MARQWAEEWAEEQGVEGVAGRGLHSSTSQLNVSIFCRIHWSPSGDRWVITRHRLDTQRITDQNGLG